MASELDRIRERYSKRTARYDPWLPWVYMSRFELERELLSLLRKHRMLPAENRRVLDFGCGTGGHLQFFIRAGFAPELLCGVDLQESRVEAARIRLPAAVRLISGDASTVDLPHGEFDIVFQSLMFSSVLDDGLQRALADRMWKLTSPGGCIIWYDFTWNNPRNPDVRGVTVRRIRELFPEAMLEVRRVTLAPPIARAVTRVSPGLYSLFNLVPLLRTHVLCWLGKPSRQKV